MPTPQLGQVAASVFEKVVGSKPEDNIFPSFFLLNEMKSSGGFRSVSGGRLVEEPLEYAENASLT